MDKYWYRNPSKSEVIGRCGGDEKTEWPRRTGKSRTLKKNKNTKAAKRQQIDTPENGEKMLVRKVETINDIENNIASDEVID